MVKIQKALTRQLQNYLSKVIAGKQVERELAGKFGKRTEQWIKNAKKVAQDERNKEWRYQIANAKSARKLKSGNYAVSDADSKIITDMANRAFQKSFESAKNARARELAGQRIGKITSPVSDFVKKHKLPIGFGAIGLGGAGYLAFSEPSKQYVGDVTRKYLYNNTGLDAFAGDTLRNENFQDSYNEDGSRLAQIAYRQYVRQHGYPKDSVIFNNSIEPRVYKEINKDGRYANFTPWNILKAAMHGDNQFEFTDGGMSGKMMKTPDGVYVHLTDETAWDLTPKERAMYKANNSPGSKVRLFMDEYGSSGGSKTANKQDLWYKIPADTIIGDYRGRLRDIKAYPEMPNEKF